MQCLRCSDSDGGGCGGAGEAAGRVGAGEGWYAKRAEGYYIVYFK